MTDKRFENWDKWVAQYNSSCDYSRQYNIWQFTDGGKVPEIPESVGVNILLARECSVSGHTYALQSVIKKPRQHTWEWLHINVRYVGIIKRSYSEIEKGIFK